MTCYSLSYGDEKIIRLAGLGLQLAGIGAAAYGVQQTRIFFNQPSVFQNAENWFHRFPLRRRDARVFSVAGLAATSGIEFGGVITGVSPDASIEVRVEFLERRLKELVKQFSDAQKKTSQRLENYRRTWKAKGAFAKPKTSKSTKA